MPFAVFLNPFILCRICLGIIILILILFVSPEIGYINIREGVIVLYFVNVWRSVTSDYFVECLYFTVSVCAV